MDSRGHTAEEPSDVRDVPQGLRDIWVICTGLSIIQGPVHNFSELSLLCPASHPTRWAATLAIWHLRGDCGLAGADSPMPDLCVVTWCWSDQRGQVTSSLLPDFLDGPLLWQEPLLIHKAGSQPQCMPWPSPAEPLTRPALPIPGSSEEGWA